MKGHYGSTINVMQIQVSAAGVGLIGFYGATPVAQHSSTGEGTGFTAGAGIAVRHTSTFTGNTGSTAYTIGDIVKALKNYGLLTS